MSAKASRKPKDQNQLAKLLVAQLTGETTPESPQVKPQKNPAAVALGRLGGLKGGKARAEKLSDRRLRAIGKKGAKARWANRPPKAKF